MPVSVFTVNKELPRSSVLSPSSRAARAFHRQSPFDRRAHAPRRPRMRHPVVRAPSDVAVGGARARRPRGPPSHGRCGRRDARRTALAPPTEHRIYIHKELNLHKHLIIHTRLHAVRDVRIAPGAGLSDSAVTLTPRRKFIAGCFGGRSPGVRRASPPLPTAPIPSGSLCVPQCLWA